MRQQPFNIVCMGVGFFFLQKNSNVPIFAKKKNRSQYRAKKNHSLYNDKPDYEKIYFCIKINKSGSFQEGNNFR